MNTQTQANKKPSFFNFQPTTKLAKFLLSWWLWVLLITIFKLSKGFWLESLSFMLVYTDWLFFACGVLFLLLAITCCIDLFLLNALSKSKLFVINRNYSFNTPIFKELLIQIFLKYDAKALPSFVISILKLMNKQTVYCEFDDDYPKNFVLSQSVYESEVHYKKHNKDNQALPVSFALSLEHVNDENEQNELGTHKKISYLLMPVQRGTSEFLLSFIRITSPLKFFRKRLAVEATENNQQNEVRVLADFSGLLTNEFGGIHEKSFDVGIQKLKKQGSGNEFLKLREYQIGDALRQVDWKASSRLNRIMSKAYEDENDQDVVFLLDCGEQMRHKTVHKTSHQLSPNYFDQVLNAILLLAHTANKQGDRVGLQTFGLGNEKEMFLAPKKGESLIRFFLNETANIQPSLNVSDYVFASQHLLKRLRKRSLVILITNTRQEANNELIQAVTLLRKQHRLIFANLTEDIVHEHLNFKHFPNSLDDALLFHTLKEHEKLRKKLLEKLTQETGTQCLSCTPDQLPKKLVQTYLTVR